MNLEHLSLVCKHKHMLKNGAPPNNSESYTVFTYGIIWFEAPNRILYVITFWFVVFQLAIWIPLKKQIFLEEIKHSYVFKGQH